MIEIEARLSELKALGLHRRTRLVSGPQGPHVVLDGKPVLLLCSNNYLGLADHPRVREAAAQAAMRWGVGAGASRLVSGTMTVHRRLEERLAAFKRRQSALLFGSGFLANAGVIAALARPGDVVFSDELNHAVADRRLPAVARGGVRLRPLRHRAPGLGARAGAGPRRADRHRRRVLDGRRRGAARGDRRTGPAPPRAADGRRGPRDRGARARRRRSARRVRARGSGRRDRRDARQGARLLRRVRRGRSGDDAVPAERRAHVHLLDRATTARDRRRARRARVARGAAAPGRQAARRTRTRSAMPSTPRGSTSAARAPRSCRSSSASPRWRSSCATRRSRAACSRRRSRRRPYRR